MPRKLRFEQVPLDVAKKALVEETEQERRKLGRGNKKKTLTPLKQLRLADSQIATGVRT